MASRRTTRNPIDGLPIDKDADVIFCTVKTYKLFLAHGRLGMEALALYMHLIFTARLQQTNQVKATDKYLMNGLQIGERKLRSLKSFLKNLGLIDYVRDRGKDGRMNGSHIKIKFLSGEHSTIGANSAHMGKFCPSRANTARAVSEDKCLNLTMKKEATGANSAPLAEPADLPAGSAGPPVDSSRSDDQVQRSPVVGRLMNELCSQIKQGIPIPDIQLKLGPFGELPDQSGEGVEKQCNEDHPGEGVAG